MGRELRVLFDHQIFKWQRFGGISRYFCYLFQNLPNHSVNYSTTVLFTINEYYRKGYWGAQNLFQRLPGFRRTLNIITKIYAILRIRAGGYDVFHPTQYSPYFLSHLGNKPFVVTIYDMIDEIYADCTWADKRASINKKLLCKKARIIIAISQSTKNDIQKFFGIPDERIIVIPLCGGAGNQQDTLCDSSIKGTLYQRYILFVGERGKYKNFSFCVEAIAPLLVEENVQLICSGGGGFSSYELELFRRLEISQRVLQIDASDIQMHSLYKNAQFLLYPSEYEGFGLPILEAMVHGCPVICSNTSSMPEVGGDAALYFHPKNGPELFDRCRDLLTDEVKRKALVTRGIERSKVFSVQKMASRTAMVYRMCIGNSL